MDILKSMVIIVFLLALVPWVSIATEKPACTTASILTKAGAVCGSIVSTSTGKKAKSYSGLPFAKTTAKNNRWRNPVARKAWKETLIATQFGDACPQSGLPATFPQSEDCLSLNIWTPYDIPASTPLPVMVYIYGGAFTAGLSSHPLYDGAYLAANKNIIIISFNYRVGVLGFLATNELDGNYGFLDQQLALKWINKNIDSFGGDPARVTLFGESAGAMSVGLHLLSAPDSVPLFRAAIMESNFFALPYKSLKDQKNVGNIFSESLSCSDLSCLKNISTARLLKAQDEFTAQVSTDFSGAKFYLPFTPNIDGTVITRQPVASLTDAKLSKPLLLGTNKDEAVLLVGSKSISPSAYAAWTASLFGDAFEKVIAKYPVNENSSNSSVWARLQTDNFLLCSSRYVASVYKAPVYVYLFNHHPMFNFLGSACGADKNVCHSAELPFVFHTVDKLGGSFSREEEQLSLKIIDYWTNFAINLEPGKSDKQDTLVWPAFVNNNKKYMNLDTPSVTITHDPYQTICEFWNAIGYDRVVPWHN